MVCISNQNIYLQQQEELLKQFPLLLHELESLEMQGAQFVVLLKIDQQI